MNPGLVLEGSWGMGAAVFDRRGRPAWALSLTGIEPRFRQERQAQLGRLLMDEAHRISTAAAGRGVAASAARRWSAPRRRPGGTLTRTRRPGAPDAASRVKVPPVRAVARFSSAQSPTRGSSGPCYFHQVSKMVTGTVRLWRVRRYFSSIRSATASGTSRPSR